jgi:V/A-type H+/Na+-transporting ATPase subunit E
MRADEASLDALERAILNEANSDVDRIRQESQSKADAIWQRARGQAESERKALLEKAKQEAERVRSQFVATSQLKARTVELGQREKLLNDVFKAAREQITSLQKDKNYEEIVAQLLREGISQLSVNKAKVRADEQTKKILEQSVIGKVSKELKAEITVGEPLEEGIGLIVEAADGRLRYNNTFENRLEHIQNELRSPVYRLLMGESQ